MDLTQFSQEQLVELEASILSGGTVVEPAEHVQAVLQQIHSHMARLTFPGPDYRDWLQKIHQLRNVKSYLEIGVNLGASLTLAEADAMAIGVDPDFKISHDVRASCKLFKLTSDDFFSDHKDNYQNSFDFAFIDGLHTAEQTLRDFENAISCMRFGGIIAIHDVLPFSSTIAEPDRQTSFWTGDVWRLIDVLCQDNQPWTWTIVPTGPSGLLILSGIDTEYDVSTLKLGQKLERCDHTSFERVHEFWKHNCADNDPAIIRKL